MKRLIKLKKMEVNSIKLSSLVFTFSIIFIYFTAYFDSDGRLYSALFDDAMIAMKYASNIANGIGPYWNYGDKVEGFTNPLWTYVMALVFKISNSSYRLAPFFVQVIACFLLSFNCYFFANYANKIITFKNFSTQEFRHKNLVYLLILLMSLCPILFFPNIYWSLMGMEVALLTPLISILFCKIFIDEELKENFQINKLDFFQIILITFFGQLTRPDFILVSLSFLISKFIIKKNFSEVNTRKIFFSTFLGLFFAGLLLMSWRNYYYDSFLPNTYTLKVSGINIFTQIYSGLGYVIPFLRQNILLIFLSLIILKTSKNLYKILLPSIFYFFIILLYQIRVGGDPWVYWRIMAPTIIILLFSVITTILLNDKFLEMDIRLSTLSLSKTFPKIFKKFINFNIIGLFLVSLFFSNFFFIQNDFFFPLKNTLIKNLDFGVYTVNAQRTNIITGNRLNSFFSENSKIAVIWGGTITYYANKLYSIDLLGKSDKYIANSPQRGGVSWGGMLTVPGHNKYDFIWSINNYDPDWIQDASWGDEDLTKSEWFNLRYKYCNYLNGYLKSNYECPDKN